MCCVACDVLCTSSCVRETCWYERSSAVETGPRVYGLAVGSARARRARERGGAVVTKESHTEAFFKANSHS